MGDSACLVHGYSNPAVLPNEFKKGNPMHALGDSISFGRFMTESLSWEKWSTFSHKKYVEEAESYSQPGSVAQKKAFFEAHYKRIAAQKAAALLEQESAANNAIETEIDKDDSADYYQTVSSKLNSHLVVDEKIEEGKNPDAIDDVLVNANEQGSISMAEIVKNKENDETKGNEYSLETHLKKSSFKKRFFPRSLRNLFNFIPINEPISVTETPKNCITPLRTPEVEPIIINGVAKSPAAIPCSERRRKETPTDPSATGSKTTHRKRHIFSAISKSLTKCRSKLHSASLSNPSILRTEETAAERKQKLEEKFKANAVQKGKLQNLLKTPAAESQ